MSYTWNPNIKKHICVFYFRDILTESWAFVKNNYMMPQAKCLSLNNQALEKWGRRDKMAIFNIA